MATSIKLGEICTSINGLWKGKKEPFIKVGVLRNANFTKDFTLDYSKTEYLDVEVRQYEKRKLEKGDLIVEKSGGSEKQPVGRTVLFEAENGEYSFSNFTSVLRVKNKNLFLSKYLYYNLLYIYRRGDTKTMQKATTGIHNLDFDLFLNILIVLRSFNDQQKIVEYLDSTFEKIDKIKEDAEKKIAEAKLLFQAALNEKLKMKEGWKYCKLGDIGTFQRGGNFKKADFVENGFPCIHYGQIHTTFGVSTETHLSSVPIDLVKKEKCAKKGDLIIAITSEDEECSCKCTAWLGDYDVYVGGHTAIFRHNLNPVLMSYYLRSSQFNKLKLEYTHGFKVVEINPKDIAKIPIAYPDSLFDQQKIVEYLDSTFEKIEKIKEDAEQIITECDRLKQAILKQVFE